MSNPIHEAEDYLEQLADPNDLSSAQLAALVSIGKSLESISTSLEKLVNFTGYEARPRAYLDTLVRDVCKAFGKSVEYEGAAEAADMSSYDPGGSNGTVR